MQEDQTAPDGITPVLGWRCWRGDDGWLVSPHIKTPWPQQPALAKCEPYPDVGEIWDPAPALIPNIQGEECSCGRTHTFLSTSCLPRAYPLSLARTKSLANPVPADTPHVPYSQWHSAPEPDCSCGWYARHQLPYKPLENLIWGAVAGWGKMEISQNGWRSQYAQILGLIGSHPLIESRYQLSPLVSTDPQQFEAKSWPATISE